MTTFSCKGCEKRYPGCHGKCETYIAEKAIHDENKAAADKKRAVEYGLDSQFGRSIYRARKIRRKGRFYD